jgi:hypothetical protein
MAAEKTVFLFCNLHQTLNLAETENKPKHILHEMKITLFTCMAME